MAKEHPLVDLCLVLGVARSTYYAWRARRPSPRTQQNELLRAKIGGLFRAHRQVYGSPRLAVCRQRQGIACSRNRVARHMRALQLKARQKRAFKPKTTDSRHDQPTAPNRLAQTPAPRSPNRIWVTDITYVLTAQGWLYLAAVMDLYSRKIVGWATSDSLATPLATAALQQALQRRLPGAGLLWVTVPRWTLKPLTAMFNPRKPLSKKSGQPPFSPRPVPIRVIPRYSGLFRPIKKGKKYEETPQR